MYCKKNNKDLPNETVISQEYGVNFASCLIWMEVDAIILVVTFSSALNLDVASEQLGQVYWVT